MFLRSCGGGGPALGFELIVLLKLYSFIIMSISDACDLFQHMVDQYSSLLMTLLRMEDVRSLATSGQPIHVRSVNLLRHHDNGCCYRACDCCIHSIRVSHSHSFQLFVMLKSGSAVFRHRRLSDGS